MTPKAKPVFRWISRRVIPGVEKITSRMITFLVLFSVRVTLVLDFSELSFAKSNNCILENFLKVNKSSCLVKSMELSSTVCTSEIGGSDKATGDELVKTGERRQKTENRIKIVKTKPKSLHLSFLRLSDPTLKNESPFKY